MMTPTEFFTAENVSTGFMDPDYGGDHWGCDFNSRSRLPAGTLIPSLSAGTVVRSAWQDAHGYYIAVTAAEAGWYWTYSHRQSAKEGPVVGERIGYGDSVGPLGNTGRSTAAHVHVQYTRFPDPWQHTPTGTIDPWPKIQASLASWAGGGTEIPNEILRNLPMDTILVRLADGEGRYGPKNAVYYALWSASTGRVFDFTNADLANQLVYRFGQIAADGKATGSSITAMRYPEWDQIHDGKFPKP